MRCPFCGEEETQVKDSRAVEEGQAIRRRRLCQICSSRFTTYERVLLCDLTILKRDGRKESFDREKLAKAIFLAARKRPVTKQHLERAINSLVRKLETMGETEIPSKIVGETAMEILKDIDAVAYIRFASVYQDFEGTEDFQNFIKKITQE